ncbi:hypothetical protein F4780DRAFT_795675 [Xylariomycetidae sp. FL0641]|nr:hypothetical protein F4780DRAFT_795675 [Xylariomycetidae sp. FL0641]
MASAPLNFTFGCELELLIAALPMGVPDPQEHIQGLPPVARIPLPSKPKFSFFSFSFKDRVLGPYRHWGVEEDSSVVENKFPPYHWYNCEIQSPVEEDSTQAYKVLEVVAALLKKNYRCRVNLTTGLHVHVGQGEERFPQEIFRRIAGLVWAAEPLLFTLQNPVRRVNYSCMPIRNKSRLALGTKAEPRGSSFLGESDMARTLSYLARDRRHGEAPISAREAYNDDAHAQAFAATRQPGHWEPYHIPELEGSSSATTTAAAPVSVPLPLGNPYTQRAAFSAPPPSPRHQRRIPRIKPPRYDRRALEALELSLAGTYGSGGTFERSRWQYADRGVFGPVATLYAAASSAHIAELMRVGSGRGAVAFAAYLADRFPGGEKRTVEFRLADGSLDGPWVAAWARVCVGLVRFAALAAPTEYVNVLAACEDAMREDGGGFDVVDLIEALGLYAEAAFAEKRIERNREAWGLEFADS